MDDRFAFDQVAELYDRARPCYPEQLFADVLSYLGPAARRPRVLEIGPGTGQATRPLLARGARVLAVELGPHLASLLERKLAPEFPRRLRVVNSSFEEHDLGERPFDLVIAATSFHWLDPAVRMRKSCDALHGGGAIAIISLHQIRSPVDRGFFARVFPIYRKHRPGEPHTELPDEDVVPDEYRELEASGLFVDHQLRRYRWDQTYTTAAYGELFRTYSNSVIMPEGPREALLADLCRVIDEELGGWVTRPLVVTLSLGRRAARACP